MCKGVFANERIGSVQLMKQRPRPKYIQVVRIHVCRVAVFCPVVKRYCRTVQVGNFVFIYLYQLPQQITPAAYLLVFFIYKSKACTKHPNACPVGGIGILNTGSP
jgi:hypothetical protein